MEEVEGGVRWEQLSGLLCYHGGGVWIWLLCCDKQQSLPVPENTRGPFYTLGFCKAYLYSAGQKNVSTLLGGISQGFLEQI